MKPPLLHFWIESGILPELKSLYTYSEFVSGLWPEQLLVFDLSQIL